MGRNILIGIVIIAVILGGTMISSYNNLNVLDEDTNAAWGQVENQLKRRADLIPNLLETVKGYASHEKEVIEGIAEARTNYSNANTPEEYAEAEEIFTGAVRNLNLIVERYPDLKANQNFQDLQAELSGTENRIATERMRYNEVVREYNTTIRKFPKNIMANMFGFDAKQYFEISEADAEVPKIEF